MDPGNPACRRPGERQPAAPWQRATARRRAIPGWHRSIGSDASEPQRRPPASGWVEFHHATLNARPLANHQPSGGALLHSPLDAEQKQMKIMVAIKQVPERDAQIVVAPSGK